MDLEERIMELSRYGYACGQILAILLLDTIGEENPALVRCMQGLNGGIGSSDGYDGWYNADNAAAELKIAIEELKKEGLEISAENPIYLDLPTFVSSEAYKNRANAYKQSVEAALGGLVIVNLTECVDSAQWYYAGYYPSTGAEGNYDVCDLSGWGPDYGDPQTYLDTMLPQYSGYMTKAIGLF